MDPKNAGMTGRDDIRIFLALARGDAYARAARRLAQERADSGIIDLVG
jgi:hypothetical protein